MRHPLFIVCPGRSFSSVVCAAIGQHPEAFGVPELNLFVHDTVGELLDIAAPFVGLPGVATGLRRTVAELQFGAQTEETIEKTDRWLAERRDWSGAKMISALGEMADGRMIVDKTPTNTGRRPLRRMLTGFPEAAYLHLARHPGPWMKSKDKVNDKRGRKRSARGTLPPAERNLESDWLERHKTLWSLSEQVGPHQYMYLKGEWFFEDPANIFRQICQWLELSDDDAAIAAMMRPEESPFAKVGPKTARYGNNPGFIESPELRIGAIPEPSLTAEGEPEFSYATRTLGQMMGYPG